MSLLEIDTEEILLHRKPAIAKNKKDVAMLCFIYETLACFYKTKEQLTTN
jgi:hypothetical protein